MRHTGDRPRISAWLGIVAVVGLLVSVAAAGQTFKPVYLGDWIIVSVQPAPWANPGEKLDASDVKALMGKTITFTAKNVRAPPPLDCTGAAYKVDAYSPDMLFEGGLTDPEKQAIALGFQGKTIPTLIPGCEIEFHFVDPGTALFGLNNGIYRMQRKPGAPPSN